MSQWQPSGPKRGAEAQGVEGEGSEDKLDSLLQRYEQQAAVDAAAVQQQQQGQQQGRQQGGSSTGGGRKRPKLSTTEKREQALSQPLGADNK